MIKTEKLDRAITCHVDCDGRIVKTNSHFGGNSPQDFVGLKLEDFIVEPSRTEYLRLLREAVRHGRVGSYASIIVTPEGMETRWTNRVSPWREDGNIVGVIMVGNQVLDQ